MNMMNPQTVSSAPPVISMLSDDVVSLIDHACSTWGTFVLTDHGITPELLAKVLALSHDDFFDLPLDGKKSATDGKHDRYIKDERKSEDSHFNLTTIGYSVFPAEIQDMRDVLLEYHRCMADLGNRLMRLLSNALQFPERYVEESVTLIDPVIVPRMFRYLPSSETSNEEVEGNIQWGVGHHSDDGLWTMILSDAPGLQIQHPWTGKWHMIPYISHFNAIVVNVGDALERLTSGRFISSFERVVLTQRVVKLVERFYNDHTEIKVSHGFRHVKAVYQHACKAIECHQPPLKPLVSMEVKLAALLHDLDDRKYFPDHVDYQNARSILHAADIPAESIGSVLAMIRLVSCSENGNTVPDYIVDRGDYYLLIPRWADRLEAVGAVGVVRCFQYNREKMHPLSSPKSPRSQTHDEVWEHATPDRFEAYQQRGGTSGDMISHYYDKLLHIARPPASIVRNSYLERMGEESAKELLEVCVRFGKTGVVDVDYIEQLASRLQ